VWVNFTEHDRTYTKWRASKSDDGLTIVVIWWGENID
jgi:hypothetical protein